MKKKLNSSTLIVKRKFRSYGREMRDISVASMKCLLRFGKTALRKQIATTIFKVFQWSLVLLKVHKLERKFTYARNSTSLKYFREVFLFFKRFSRSTRLLSEEQSFVKM